jgi:ribosomal-protein-alanine N-acetyltransferase
VTVPVATEVVLRPARVEDAATLARLYAGNREFLAPFDPPRQESFFTEDGQRAGLRRLAELRAAGSTERFLIVCDGEVVGVLSVSNIIRGPLQSATIGYFVSQRHNGRGIASRAVALVAEWAFENAGLHRIEAGTLPDNIASQRVLERNGFARIGYAPKYLFIGGEWRDHVLFHRVVDDPVPRGPTAK